LTFPFNFRYLSYIRTAVEGCGVADSGTIRSLLAISRHPQDVGGVLYFFRRYFEPKLIPKICLTEFAVLIASQYRLSLVHKKPSNPTLNLREYMTGRGCYQKMNV
jgi:hypothetical protein